MVLDRCHNSTYIKCFIHHSYRSYDCYTFSSPHNTYSCQFDGVKKRAQYSKYTYHHIYVCVCAGEGDGKKYLLAWCNNVKMCETKILIVCLSSWNSLEYTKRAIWMAIAEYVISVTFAQPHTHTFAQLSKSLEFFLLNFVLFPSKHSKCEHWTTTKECTNIKP